MCPRRYPERGWPCQSCRRSDIVDFRTIGPSWRAAIWPRTHSTPEFRAGLFATRRLQKNQRLVRQATLGYPAQPFLLGPGLLPALALEHADGAAGLGVEHGPDQSGLPITMTACPDRVGVVAGKDFVFEFAAH